jgi:hypothetical protein
MTDLNVIEQGDAEVTSAGGRWTLGVPPTSSADYSNAMLTTYRSRQDFSFVPYTRLELTAHLEGELHGTAGFGFWNHPYGLGLRLPRAIWFFFSSRPNDMPLAMGVSGHGFKAAVFDAQRWLFYILLPATPIGLLLMRVPALYRRLWPVGQRAIGVDEIALAAALLQVRRRYTIEWNEQDIVFMIDHEIVFSTRNVPRGKLGFVAWIDNQYAVVTPQGKFRFGLVDVPARQQLILDEITLTTRPPQPV